MAADIQVFDKEIVAKIKKEMIPETEIYEISDFFKVFGDSTRLKILWILDGKKLSVGDICNILDATKSAVSHQLNTLKMNKLVKYERIGKNIFYSLDDEHVSMIIEIAKRHLEEK